MQQSEVDSILRELVTDGRIASRVIVSHVPAPKSGELILEMTLRRQRHVRVRSYRQYQDILKAWQDL